MLLNCCTKYQHESDYPQRHAVLFLILFCLRLLKFNEHKPAQTKEQPDAQTALFKLR